MSTPNPFATTSIAPTAPVAPVAPVAEVVAPVAATETPVDEAVVEKAKKAKKPRDPNKPKTNNKKMEEADRIDIIKRYQSEDIGAIAASMGYTRSQAYNVIRNTRIAFEDEIKKSPDMSPERKAAIERGLEMVKGKEFGRGAIAGTAAKSAAEKVDDILAGLLG